MLLRNTRTNVDSLSLSLYYRHLSLSLSLSLTLSRNPLSSDNTSGRKRNTSNLDSPRSGLDANPLLSKHGAQLTPVLLHEDSTHSKTRGEGREGGRRSRLSKKVYWDQIRKHQTPSQSSDETLSRIEFIEECNHVAKT
jgi:hypothetical protein